MARVGSVASGRARIGIAARWLLLGLLLAPWLAGLLLAASLDGLARTIPETLFWISLGVVPALLLALRRGRLFVMRRSRLGGALGLALLVLVLVGSLWQAGLLVADWVAPLDHIEATVTASPYGARWLRLSIITTDASYDTPMFWTPRVPDGPANLTLGHFSRKVVSID